MILLCGQPLIVCSFYPNPPKQAVRVGRRRCFWPRVPVQPVEERLHVREAAHQRYAKDGGPGGQRKDPQGVLPRDGAVAQGRVSSPTEQTSANDDSTGAPRAFVFHHAVRVTDSRHHVNGLKKDDIGKKFLPQAAVLAAHLDQSLNWQPCQVLPNSEVPGRGRGPAARARHDRQRLAAHQARVPPPLRHRGRIHGPSLGPRRAPEPLVQGNSRVDGHTAEQRAQVVLQVCAAARDVLMFRSSRTTHGPARACPHTAFVDKEYESADARESIEIRAFLLWPDHESVLHEPKL